MPPGPGSTNRSSGIQCGSPTSSRRRGPTCGSVAGTSRRGGTARTAMNAIGTPTPSGRTAGPTRLGSPATRNGRRAWRRRWSPASRPIRTRRGGIASRRRRRSTGRRPTSGRGTSGRVGDPAVLTEIVANAAKPVTAEAMSEHIDSPMVASPEAVPAPARACHFVRLSLPHCRKPDELRNCLFTVCPEERCQVLSDPCLAML